jgi:hypothetical protein
MAWGRRLVAEPSRAAAALAEEAADAPSLATVHRGGSRTGHGGVELQHEEARRRGVVTWLVGAESLYGGEEEEGRELRALSRAPRRRSGAESCGRAGRLGGGRGVSAAELRSQHASGRKETACAHPREALHRGGQQLAPASRAVRRELHAPHLLGEVDGAPGAPVACLGLWTFFLRLLSREKTKLLIFEPAMDFCSEKTTNGKR